METLEKLQKEIEELEYQRTRWRAREKKQQLKYREWYDPDDTTPYCSDISELKFQHELLRNNLEIEGHAHGYLVNNKFIVTPNMKWRNKNSNKWYWYKSIDHLVENYINKDS